MFGLMTEFLRSAFQNANPILEAKPSDSRPQPCGSTDLALQQGSCRLGPAYGQDQPRETRSAPEIEEGLGLQGRSPRPCVAQVPLDRLGTQKPKAPRIGQNDFQALGCANHWGPIRGPDNRAQFGRITT